MPSDHGVASISCMHVMMRCPPSHRGCSSYFYRCRIGVLTLKHDRKHIASSRFCFSFCFSFVFWFSSFMMVCWNKQPSPSPSRLTSFVTSSEGFCIAEWCQWLPHCTEKKPVVSCCDHSPSMHCLSDGN